MHYFLLLLLKSNTKDFDLEFFRKVPSVIVAEGSTKLTQLREYLQGEGRLREARAILDQELVLHENGVGQERACRSLLEACSASETLEPTWWIAGRVRTRLSQVLNARGQRELARQELVSAEKLFQQACASGISNRTVLLVRVAELKALPQTDKSEVLRSWATFSEDLQVKEDLFVLTTAIGMACDVALAIFETNPNYKDIFWQWYKKAESIHERVGDILKLYIARQATGDIAARQLHDYSSILVWHKHFDAKYSAFNLWRPKMNSRKTKLFIYNDLKEGDPALLTVSEMKEIKANQDEFWSEEGFKSSDQIAQANLSESNANSEPKAIYYADYQQIDWLTGFSNEFPVYIRNGSTRYRATGGSPFIGSPIILEQTLLLWIRRASSEGILTVEDLGNVLLDPGADQNIDVSSLIDSLTPQTLSDRLFGKFDIPTSTMHWEKAFSTLSEWLFKKSNGSESKRHYLLHNIQFQRQEQCALQLQGSARSEETIVKETQRLLDLFPKLNEEVQQQVACSRAPVRNTLAAAKYIILVKKTGHVFLDARSPEFQNILSLYKQSLAENREEGQIRAEAYTLMNIAHLYFYTALKPDPSVLETFIETLSAAMDAFEKIREGWRALQGWDKVDKVTKDLEDDYMHQIAPLMIAVLCKNPRPHEIWNVIQEAKSMGLGWLMRVNAAEAPPIDPDSPKSEPMPKKLEEIPFFSIKEVRAIDEPGGNAVFVDWYNSSSRLHEMPRPIMGLLVPGRPPICTVPNITWREINDTTRELMKFDTADLLSGKNLKTLYKLNPLVEALALESKPGQILVFSPFGNLHRLPLHALQCDGQPLIQRNPIVYCSSLSVLTAAFRARRAFEQTFFQDQRHFKVSVFGDPPTVEGKAALASVGQILHTKPIVNSNFRASRFIQAIQTPDLHLIHFHGHAEFSETAPLDQGLVFKDRNLTLRDIFEIPPRPANNNHRSSSHHVTMLGCGSGMSKTTVSNEVFGLVPSLFHAGASSTVSTLWPFSDQDAALYSKHFYDEFESAMTIRADDGGEAAFVNLAVANQKAVLKIMEQRPALYHWAPFVLNGYWMLQVSPPRSSSMTNQTQDQH